MMNTLPVWSDESLRRRFAHPSRDAKPWVFWYWVDGNISLEGALADLHAMHDVGIGGAYLMDIGHQIPEGPVAYRSDEWYDIVRQVCVEARKIGFQLGFHSPGWTESGGPWIRPEDSMKELTWSEETVEGPTRVTSLSVPFSRLGVYRDIAVVAVPASEDRNPVQLQIHDENGLPLSGVEAAIDRNPDTFSELPCRFILSWEKPSAVRSLVLCGHRSNSASVIEVEAWNPSSQQFELISRTRANVAGPFSSHLSDCSFDPVCTDKLRITCSPSRQLRIGEIHVGAAARIPRWTAKAGFCAEDLTSVDGRNSRASNVEIIGLDQVKVLHRGEISNNRIASELPAGRWTIIRMGYTSTGVEIYPACPEALGLECDKMNRKATERHYRHFMGDLLDELGGLQKHTVRFHHLDSYESGWQNWTDGFDQIFASYYGYQLYAWLPALTGRCLGSEEATERFLWDFRNAISRAYQENHYLQIRELAHRDGMEMSNEPYGGPFNFIRNGAVADRPMAEFWLPLTPRKEKIPFAPVFAGRTNGRRIISAEAFTSRDDWQAHPASLKAAGDYVYASGINHFTLHVYAHQPFLREDLKPGLTVGGVGVQFNRNNTWWKHGGKEWIAYLTRCQELLQSGEHQADILYFQGDEPMGDNRWMFPAAPSGYDFDVCAEPVFMQATCRDGKIVLPCGKKYRLLVMPQHGLLTTPMLEKMYDLIADGALVYAPKVKETPSEADYRKNSSERKSLVEAIWDHATPTGKKIGRGRVIWGCELGSFLSAETCDFAYDAESSPLLLNYTHRSTGQEDIYFVANGRKVSGWTQCRFRVPEDRIPSFWNAETGEISPCLMYVMTEKGCEMPLCFGPEESKFIVFEPRETDSHVLALTRDGKPLTTCELVGEPSVARLETTPKQDFIWGAWVNPGLEITLPEEKESGIAWDGQNWLVFPQPGHQLYGSQHSGAGLSVGTNGAVVFEHWDCNVAPVLSFKFPEERKDWFHLGLVYRDGRPSLYLDGKLVHSGLKTGKTVHSSFRNLDTKLFVGTYRDLRENTAVAEQDLTAWAAIEHRPETVASRSETPVNLKYAEDGRLEFFTETPGSYCFRLSDGTEIEREVEEPQVMDLGKDWNLSVDGGLSSRLLTCLKSWSEMEEEPYRFFSGSASYARSFYLEEALAENSRALLDLGRVEVIAEVRVNGQNAGTLWHAPYQVDITPYLLEGTNELEVVVTNQYANRLIGERRFADQLHWHGNGVLAQFPKWVYGENEFSVTHASFTTYSPWDEETPLLKAGLIGPVKLKFVTKQKL